MSHEIAYAIRGINNAEGNINKTILLIHNTNIITWQR